MSTRPPILFLLLTSLLLALPSLSGRAAPPNILLIITDDQGYGDLSCHGNKIIRTPALDKLHQQSARLLDFHSSPTCAPTRAAVLTGKNPLRAGIWHTVQGRSMLREGEKTLAEYLASAGYETGLFGKWHLGDNFPNRPQDHGYGEVLTHGSGGVGQTPDFWGNDYFDDTYMKNGQPVACEGYCTQVWCRTAAEFIKTNKDKPFFCHLALNAPHSPYNAPPEKLKELEGRNDVPNAAFYAMIEDLDTQLGAVLSQLDTLGLAENTIVIFMTDNGTAAGIEGDKGFNAGMRGKKGSPYEGGHRVPCFIRWPAGKIQNRDVTQLAAHYDLFPTLLECAGVAIPADHKLDGISLARHLRGETKEKIERSIIVDSQRVPQPIMWRESAVLNGSWRLINGVELYDLASDPGQKDDLAKAQPAELQRLRAIYEAWWTELKPTFAIDPVMTVGNSAANPVFLTGHDWMVNDGACPFDQNSIKKGTRGNGPWSLRVDQEADYEITLRRWPFTENLPLSQDFFEVKTARIRIGSMDETRPVPPDAIEISFRAALKPGPVKLQTWLLGKDDQSCGAYYAKIEKLDPPPPPPPVKEKTKPKTK